ncbi:MAG: hypothetical protein ACHQ1D_00720 [Nitrososphaerales archaeon]
MKLLLIGILLSLGLMGCATTKQDVDFQGEPEYPSDVLIWGDGTRIPFSMNNGSHIPEEDSIETDEIAITPDTIGFRVEGLTSSSVFEIDFQGRVYQHGIKRFLLTENQVHGIWGLLGILILNQLWMMVELWWIDEKRNKHTKNRT